MKKRQSPYLAVLRGLLLPVIVVAALLCFSAAVNNLENGRSSEEKQRLEETLRRSCVACYAAEGVYPPNVDYLKAHYGLQIDEKRYIIRYSVYGENLMPDITILENN